LAEFDFGIETRFDYGPVLDFNCGYSYNTYRDSFANSAGERKAQHWKGERESYRRDFKKGYGLLQALDEALRHTTAVDRKQATTKKELADTIIYLYRSFMAKIVMAYCEGTSASAVRQDFERQLVEESGFADVAALKKAYIAAGGDWEEREFLKLAGFLTTDEKGINNSFKTLKENAASFPDLPTAINEIMIEGTFALQQNGETHRARFSSLK
jgi:hypothetical protein